MTTTTQSGLYTRLFADLFRRWMWHALALCTYVVVLSQALDLDGEANIEYGIISHGVFVCLFVFGIMDADNRGGVTRILLTLPVGRSRLAVLAWAKLVILPPLMMIATYPILFFGWGGSAPSPVLEIFLLAVITLGSLMAVATWWAELQCRRFALFGNWRGLKLLLYCVLGLVLLTAVFATTFGRFSSDGGLQPGNPVVVVAGVILSSISCARREWLLHIYVEHRQGNLKRGLRRRRTRRPLRYTRFPWLSPVLIRDALVPASILIAFVVAFLALEGRYHSLLINYEPRVIRFGFGAVVVLILPFMSTTRPFPLKAYRTVPLSSWGLTARMAAFYAAPTAACALAMFPLFLFQPDGPLFFLSLLCVGVGVAVTAAIGREITRLFHRIPLVILFVVFFMMAYTGLFRVIVENETPGFGFIVSGLLLTAISAWMFCRNVTRSSEVYRLENRLLAKENA